MKLIMYETGEFASVTGGTKRFRELWNYISENESAVMFAVTDGIATEHGEIVKLKKDRLEKYRFFRYVLTRIAFRNKELIQALNSAEYDCLFVFDVPSAIGISLLNVKHICLMCRKDTLLYRKLLLESKGDNRFRINCWMAYLHVCELICLLKAETIIVQCRFDRDQLLGRHPFFRKSISKKLIVQINNVNPEWIVKNSNAPIEVTIPSLQDGINICCVCNFKDKRKGADIILEAFVSVYESSNNISLYMIGGGEELAEYKKMYEKYPNIHFLGNQSNPISYLKQCDYAVVPSRADSCPNTVMEAVYNEIPVIGSNAGGIPDILVDKDALFEPDVLSLAEKLRQMENKEFRERLKERQRERKKELIFNWPEKILSECRRGAVSTDEK